MNIYILNIKNITKKDEEFIRKNFPVRYKNSLKYSKSSDYLLSIGVYLLLNKYIKNFNEDELKYGKNGKPYLERKPFFNYSHSDEYVALAISDKQEVGVDIQIIKKDEEYTKNFTKIEAELKLLGTGICDLKNIKEFKSTTNIETIKIKDNYYLSVSTKNKESISVHFEHN